jgi:hypothetical protein
VFAGSVNGSSVLVNPIGPILNRLKVKMVAGCGGGSAPAGKKSANAPALAANSLSSETAAPPAAERPGDADIDDAIGVQERHHDALMKAPDAVGTGVGVGRQPGSTEIEVYLSKDNPQARAAIPAQLEGKPVRVIVTGKFVAY